MNFQLCLKMQDSSNSGHTLKAWSPRLIDSWGESDNSLLSIGYSIGDGLYVTKQFFTPWKQSSHLDSEFTQGKDKTDAFVSAATALLPYGKLIPRFSSAQFSSFFRGTFVAGLKQSTRGILIRH